MKKENKTYLDVKNELLQALAKNDRDAVFDAMRSLERVFLHSDTLPMQVFALLLRVLNSPQAIKSKETMGVLDFFDRYWRNLSSRQRDCLLHFLEKHYSQFRDDMSLFTISEILGECYCNVASLAATKRLLRIQYSKARIYLPHMFEHHASDSECAWVRYQAHCELKKLLQDKSLSLVKECESSLSIVKGRLLNRRYVPRKAYEKMASDKYLREKS